MDDEQQNRSFLYRRLANAGSAFSPSAPIERLTLFAGRHDQISRCIDIAYRRGQHAIIFGERGVGKTSLANLIADFMAGADDQPDAPPEFLTPRVNCTAISDFDSIWREVFREISRTEKTKDGLSIGDYSQVLSNRKLDPGMVQHTLRGIAVQQEVIIVIDEFNELRDAKARRLMADTLKTLSDHSVGVTIFLVGVADTVDQLIADHQSVARAMMQVQMPRMTAEEIKEIVERGLQRFNFEDANFQLHATDEALNFIITLARGLPHYAHLLAQKACYIAIEDEQPEITYQHVMRGLVPALEDSRPSTLSSYDAAVYSAHKNATLCETLTACALAPTDRLGCFSPSDVLEPLVRIRNKPVQIASFAKHLAEFCEQKRSSVLEKKGDKRRVRYRFTDSLMGPYVIMRSLLEGRIDPRTLNGGMAQPSS
jgi:Cdc6-like AAA superfamily ATPase